MDKYLMPISEARFYEEGHRFINLIHAKLSKLKINCSALEPDHLCYRVSNQNEYVEMKNFLLGIGRLLGEVEVNGRPIATYELNKQFSSTLGDIQLVELPAPKPTTHYPTGYEHIEFVISESFEEFCAHYPGLKFSAPNSKALNQEMALKLDEHQVKFHYTPLDRVISIEDTPITDIIFDLDGTIIDSKEKIYQINLKTLEKVLGQEMSMAEIKGKFAPEFSKLFSNFGVASSEISRAVSVWSEISRTYSFNLFAGVKEAITLLKENGFRLHLWSARDEASGMQILNQHGLDQIWATRVFWKERASKPEAKSFLDQADNFKPATSILVGDSGTDMIAAKNLTAVAGAALWDPTINLNSLISSGAELFLRHPQDLVTWVNQVSRS